VSVVITVGGNDISLSLDAIRKTDKKHHLLYTSMFQKTVSYPSQ
jgi:hypothetical protein